jgi:hypothetical protein
MPDSGLWRACEKQSPVSASKVFPSRIARLPLFSICPHCHFYAGSGRIYGYCSWDCYDADGD